MGQVIIGMKPDDRWFDGDPDERGVVLGTRAVDPVNPFNEYIAVQANGAIDQYDACLVENNGQAAAATDGNADDGDNGLLVLGVAQHAFQDNQFGWLLIRGTGRVNVLASAAADASLETTATAGHLDDTTANEDIEGIKLTTARGGSAGDAPCRLRYPYVE